MFRILDRMLNDRILVAQWGRLDVHGAGASAIPNWNRLIRSGVAYGCEQEFE
jgi:hypothetical protein